MRVVIAGGHGQVALALGRLLVARGDRVGGLIRNAAQSADLEQVGVEAIVCDLEQVADARKAVGPADAVVFAAGAGAGSGAERKRTMDYGGAVKLIEAAKANGVARYLMVSAIGAGNPPDDGGTFGAYLRAKAAADERLASSGLAYTIVRPGSLTNDAGTGLVEIAERVERRSISRADVAATLAAALEIGQTIGKAFELVAGTTPISEALAAL